MFELEARLEKSTIEAGERTTLRIHVHNQGDDCADVASIVVRAPESIALISTGPFVRPKGSSGELEFSLPAPLRGERHDIAIDVYALAPGDAEFVVAIECDGARRECGTRCTVYGDAAFAREANRVELFESEAAAGDAVRGRAILTNTGNAPANVVALHAGGDLQEVTFDALFPFAIDPGTRRCVGIRARVANTALDGTPQSLRVTCRTETQNVELGEAHVLARNHARLEGSIEPLGYTDVALAPGERAAWCVRLVNAGGALADFTIALHVAGGAYLPGSTRIEGARALDAGGTSPLWSRDGMRVERLQRGAGMTLEFATVADAGAVAMSILARASCEGRESLFESPAIRLADCSEVPTLPFIVEGLALRRIEPPHFVAPAPSSPRMHRSAASALEAVMASYLRGLDGLMRHLWALAVLCADTCDDPDLDVHLKVSRIALRSVFDRLAIKLRMPHYPVRADDVLDSSAVDALDACGIGAGALGTRLSHATQLIGSERDEYPEFASYRDALRATLADLRDDAAFIDALVKAQPALDERLDALVEREIGVHV